MTLAPPTSTPVAGVESSVTAQVKGGQPPYLYLFSYSVTAISSCSNKAAIASDNSEMPCRIVFSAPGSFSVSVKDASGTMATSNSLSIDFKPITPNPTPQPTPTPGPSACGPSIFTVACSVQIICSSDGSTPALLDPINIQVAFNMTGILGSIVVPNTSNLKIKTSGYSNLVPTAGTGVTCAFDGAWFGAGSLGCTVDRYDDPAYCSDP